MIANERFRRELALAIGGFFVLGSAIAFITASYLSKGSIQYFFSFHGSDGPAGYADSVVPTRWGVHLFGDYLLPRWQSRLTSPWYIDDPANGPVNNYFPFTMAMFWVFSHFDYWRSFVVYLLLPLIGLFSLLWRSFNSETLTDRARLLFSLVVLTAPFVSLLDRGNIQLYVIWFIALGLHFLFRGRPIIGAVFLGLAIALKGYPIIFLVLWIRKKNWVGACYGAMVAAVATVIPLLFYDGGITANIHRILRNVKSNEELYAVESLAYNNSFKGTLLALKEHAPIHIDRFAGLLYDHFQPVALLIGLVAVFLMLQRSIDVATAVLIGAATTTTVVDFVGGYAVATFFVFLIGLGGGELTIAKWRARVICILLATQFAPKGFPVKFWAQDPNGPVATYTSLLGGTTSLLIIVIAGWEYASKKWARGDLNPHVLANTGT